MPSGCVRLFVYGSLKRGGRHHDQLAGARFVGLAETGPGYRLEQLGEYPALVRIRDASSAASVKGELFEVDASQLPALDAFEGDAYMRGQITLNATPTGPVGEELRKGVFALAYLKKAD